MKWDTTWVWIMIALTLIAHTGVLLTWDQEQLMGKNAMDIWITRMKQTIGRLVVLQILLFT